MDYENFLPLNVGTVQSPDHPPMMGLFITRRALIMHDMELLRRFTDAAVSYGLGTYGNDLDALTKYVNGQLKKQFGESYFMEYDEIATQFGYDGLVVRVDAIKPTYATDTLQ